MLEPIIDKKYSNFINTLLFLFVLFMNINNTVADIILSILAFIGVYFAIKNRINLFKEEQLKIIFLVTFTYYLISFIVNTVNGIFIAKYLQTDLYFLLAVFVAIAITRAKININIVLLGMKIALILLGLGYLFSFQVSNSFISIFAPITTFMTFGSMLNFNKVKLLEKIIGAVAFLAGIVLIIDSGIVVSWLTFTVLLLVSLIFFIHKNKIVIFSFVLFFLVAFFAINPPDILKHKTGVVYDQIIQWSMGDRINTSVGLRLEMYKSSSEAFEEKPFFGHGYLQGTKEVAKYADPSVSEIISQFVQLHSEYVTTIIEKGLVGFISLLMLLFVPFYVFFSNYIKRDVYSMLGIFVSASFITFGMFNTSFGDTSMKACYVFFLCILLPRFTSKRKAN
jgi:O-antigen ligase